MPDQFEQELRRHLEREASQVPGFSRELRDRIRDRIDTRPRFTFPQQLALAAAMVLLVGILAYGISQVRDLGHGGPAGSGSPRPTFVPTATPAPTSAATPTPVATPTPAATATSTSNLGPFVCLDSSGGTSATANLTKVDAGNHENETPGYDRLVFRFDSATVPNYTITRQENPNFVMDASGQPVTLAGSAGIKVVFQHTDGHTAFSGSRDFKPGLTEIKEVRQIGDNEGYVSWAIGLAHPSCIRVLAYSNPGKLVIDVQAP
jgi:hypothetical protein